MATAQAFDVVLVIFQHHVPHHSELFVNAEVSIQCVSMKCVNR